jgi:hypothetical protein
MPAAPPARSTKGSSAQSPETALTDVRRKARAGLAVRDDFTWFDDERLIRFGSSALDDAPALLTEHGFGGCAAIPTTLSGAEMTRGHRMPAGVPEPDPVQRPYWRWCQRATLVISDPRLMASQPMPDLAASALNALAHAAEAPGGACRSDDAGRGARRVRAARRGRDAGKQPARAREQPAAARSQRPAHHARAGLRGCRLTMPAREPGDPSIDVRFWLRSPR